MWSWLYITDLQANNRRLLNAAMRMSPWGVTWYSGSVCVSRPGTSAVPRRHVSECPGEPSAADLLIVE